MWTKARCVAALDNRLPDAVTVAVEFKKPVFLPGTVAFGARARAGLDFVRRLRDGDPHLLGASASADPVTARPSMIG